MNNRIESLGYWQWYDDQNYYHRDDDLPAEIGKATKSQFWYFHGKWHRTFGPSSEWSDGDIRWEWLGKRD